MGGGRGVLEKQSVPETSMLDTSCGSVVCGVCGVRGLCVWCVAFGAAQTCCGLLRINDQISSVVRQYLFIER